MKKVGMLLTFLCLSGCGPYQPRIHGNSLQAREIGKSGTIAILSMLPDHASIIPKRHIATPGWHINQHIEHWVDQRLKRNRHFRVIRVTRAWVRAHWKASGGNALFGLSKSDQKVRPIRVIPLVPSMGARRVLVIGPRYITGLTPLLLAPLVPLQTIGAITPVAVGAAAGAFAGLLLSLRRGLHGEGLGYGVIQRQFLDERDADNYVFLYMWLFNGRSGSLIATTVCRSMSTRLDDANRKSTKVQELWIHRHGPLSPQIWADTKVQIMTLAKKSVTKCLHNLAL